LHGISVKWAAQITLGVIGISHADHSVH
jgi:hypothetical protein